MTFDRRTLLKAAAVTSLMPAAARAMTGDDTQLELSPLAQAARDVWLYSLPLIENAGTRQEVMDTKTAPGNPLHTRELITPATQTVTTPNNDTLYSRVWFDLDAGPAKIILPAVGDRYVSYQFMDMYANTFAILGTRTTGNEGGAYTLVGPRQASADPRALRSPTRWVWMTARVLVKGPRDLPAAVAVQNRMRFEAPPAPPPSRPYATHNDAWDAYFESAQALLNENPPPATDDRFFERVRPLGFKPGGIFEAKRFSETQISEINKGIAAAKRQIPGLKRGSVIGGWSYPKPNLFIFGQDYDYRATCALAGLGGLPVVEAMYMRPAAPDGSFLFDAQTAWRLPFAPGALPKVDAFWSLSMYRATEDGRFYFIDNPLSRYAIGTYTPGLRYGPGQSLDIWVSSDDPGPERRANWLPAPKTGKFGLFFRAYLPSQALLDGLYRLPPIQAV